VGRVIGSEKVRFDDLPEPRRIQLVDRRKVADPRVVDQDVETTQRLRRPVDQCALVAFTARVGRAAGETARRNVAPKPLKTGAHALVGPPRDRDREPVACQPPRDCEADTPRCSRDEGDAAVVCHAAIVSERERPETIPVSCFGILGRDVSNPS
jgi:hypothetical protein